MVCHRRVARKNPMGGRAGFQLADPSLAHFLEHPTTVCPRSVIHAGQNSARNFARELDTEQSCVLSSFDELKSKGKRSGAYNG